MIAQSDFDAVRVLQADLVALDGAEQELARQLSEARSKEGQLINSIRTAMTNPRSSWDTVSALDKDLASVQHDIELLLAADDPKRTDQIDGLRADVEQKINALLGVTS